MATQLLFFCVCVLFINNLVAADEGQAIDSFYDEDDATNWVILSGSVNDDLSSKWDVNEVWDTIDENIETQKGHYASRKCQNIFGQIVCLCQFKRLLGEQHFCRQSTSNEIKRSKMLRSRPAFSRGTNTARLPFKNMALAARQPVYNNLNREIRDEIRDRVESDKEIVSLKEEAMENDIAAAQIELDNGELSDFEVDELADNLGALMEKEEELIEEEVDNEAGEDLFQRALERVQDEDEEDLYADDYEQDDNAFEEYQVVNDEYEDDVYVDDDDDLNDDLAQHELVYDEQMINVLEEAAEVQNNIIGKQSAIIEQLKEENAAKEEVIEILDEDSDYQDDNYVDDDYVEDNYADDNYVDDNDADDEFDNDSESASNAFVNIVNDEYYENDDAEDAVYLEENDEYYDNIDDDKALAQEEYDELYDVDGEENKDEQYDDEYIDDEFGEKDQETEKDLQADEAQAMIADTFWGLEIYTVAFMILCGCCVACYCYKTSCCGYCAPKKETFTYGHYEQSEFKRVFGNVDDDMEDVEMGKAQQNDSDEAEMLQS